MVDFTGSVTLQVLGTGSADTSPSLLLTVPRKRGTSLYLFNAGEGMQRLCSEQHLRLSQKLRRVFLTSLTSETVGGLPGLLITLADAGHSSRVPIHGPAGTFEFLRASSNFMPAHAKLGWAEEAHRAPTADVCCAQVGVDDGLRIRALVLSTSAAAVRAQAQETPAPLAGSSALDALEAGGVENAPSTKRRRLDAALANGARAPAAAAASDPAAASGGHAAEPTAEAAAAEAVCYAVELPPGVGKFDAERARALGIEGRARGALCRGECVTLPGGRVVQPSEVVGAPTPGQVVLVLRCPTVAHARLLLRAADALGELVGTMPVSACAHLCPDSVWASDEYARVCELLEGAPAGAPGSAVGATDAPAAGGACSDGGGVGLGAARARSSVQHLVLDRTVCTGGHVFVSSARVQALLHAVQPTAFPFPHADERALAPLAPRGAAVHRGALLGRLTVRPLDRRQLDLSECERLVRWTNSRGEAQSLSREHLAAELRAVEGLGGALAALPSRLRETAARDGAGSAAAAADAATASAGGECGVGTTAAAAALAPCVAGASEPPPSCALAAFCAAQHRALLAEEAARAPRGGPAPCAAEASGSPTDEGEVAMRALVHSGVLDGGELVFLGTGAAMPSKYRNVSATLLRLPRARGSVLLDCGEGTLGQLRRRFGVRGARRELAAVRVFWVSHAHADHHLGLPALLAERARAVGSASSPAAAAPPLVLAPRRLERWLDVCARTLAQPCAHAFAHCTSAPDALPALGGLGVRRAQVVPAVHCADAWCLVLSMADGWACGYSGDSRPCEPFVAAAAAECSLLFLVHEATFEDELAEEALARRHCTVSEALAVGARARAQRVCLTHFSQRYPKVADVGGTDTRRACIAFDLMSVPLRLLPDAPALAAPVQLLFAREGSDEEERAAQSQMVARMAGASQTAAAADDAGVADDINRHHHQSSTPQDRGDADDDNERADTTLVTTSLRS